MYSLLLVVHPLLSVVYGGAGVVDIACAWASATPEAGAQPGGPVLELEEFTLAST